LICNKWLRFSVKLCKFASSKEQKTSNNDTMTIRQLSVFLENKTGHLNQILSVLARNNINIIALTVADSSDYGILRAIVSDPEKALQVLRAGQFTVRVHDILSLEMDAAPGSMSHILDLFTAADICIEYVYAFSFGSKSILMLRTDNSDKAVDVIKTNKLKSISEADLK
ncbi:MAG TPA: ACT domain-containing protein, partial [Paludibacter sp.]|nr:ACT domain-containing protein [Paludibacter sp.]